MSKGAYFGVNGAARKVKAEYIGVNGAARKVNKGYIGIDGAVRETWGGLEVKGLLSVIGMSHIGNEYTSEWMQFSLENGIYISNMVAITPTVQGQGYLTGCTVQLVVSSSILNAIRTFRLYRKYSSEYMTLTRSSIAFDKFDGGSSFFTLGQETELMGKIEF